MQIREPIIPHVVEDFSPGDRIYRVYKTKPVLMGTIIRASGLSVVAKMDNGVEKRIPVGNFTCKPHHQWGKALNLHDLSKGDRISVRGYGKERIFATVLNLVPGSELTLEMELQGKNGTEKAVQTFSQTDQTTLEWLFVKWEIEG